MPVLFTESQNHLDWKKPLEIIWSKSLLKQVHSEQIAQGCVQVGFEYFQRWRLLNLPEQQVLSAQSPSQYKVFPQIIQIELPVFHLCPFLVLSLGFTQKGDPDLLTSALKIFVYIDKVPLTEMTERNSLFGINVGR